MDYSIVSTNEALRSALDVLSRAETIGYDTEFVAEDCYQPDLCLLQLSTRDEIYLVDPRADLDLAQLWKLLSQPGRRVIVHAGREEILFVYRETGQPIAGLFDVQVAAGLLGGEYPSSYGKLLQRILGVSVPKGETRTNWRARPLSRAQLEYAALDVQHLHALYDHFSGQLAQWNRTAWLDDELAMRQRNLIRTQQQESWVRMSGVQSLQPQQLGIVRELWKWREERARWKNMPPRRVLRDDLIVELARRGATDPKRIAHVRGLHHKGLERFLPEIAACIERGKRAGAPADIPWAGGRVRSKHSPLLQQFLVAAMAYLCRTNNIAPSIVGSSDDVGRLIAYWLEGSQTRQTEEELPTLLQGWRGELIGRPLEKIFRGQQALRVDDPLAEMPLKLCSAGPSTDVAPAEHSDDAAAASSPSRQRVAHESLAAKSSPRVPGGKE